jgi:hypothetical protein
MLLFLDTEFTDFQDCELISVGLVSEDGHFEFYGERTDFNYDACSTFVRSKVWAHLGRYPAAKVKQAELTVRLCTWFASLPEAVTLAADSERDVTLLLRALGTGPSPTIQSHVDLRPMLETACVRAHLKAFHTKDLPRHHALYDAQALRSAWVACACATALLDLRGGATLANGKGAHS